MYLSEIFKHEIIIPLNKADTIKLIEKLRSESHAENEDEQENQLVQIIKEKKKRDEIKKRRQRNNQNRKRQGQERKIPCNRRKTIQRMDRMAHKKYL